MADTRALRALIRKGVRVRLPPSALIFAYFIFWQSQYDEERFISASTLKFANISHVGVLFDEEKRVEENE
jgi:hypothetical protein